uniref:Uncharacterized protein n=1 Tax=Helianthus annuus TaxID=4232 RepID=A0A251TP98_HELAN
MLRNKINNRLGRVRTTSLHQRLASQDQRARNANQKCYRLSRSPSLLLGLSLDPNTRYIVINLV